MVGGTAGVGVVLGNGERRAMVEQPIENIRRFVRRRRDDGDMVGTMLVRDIGVEREAGIDTIAGVDLAGAVAALA